MTSNLSPLARRIARLAGLDPETVTASGADGRVRAQDVLAALPDSSPAGRQIGPVARDFPVSGRIRTIHLESSCDTGLLRCLTRDGGAAAPGGVPFAHAVAFMAAHALVQTPGMWRRPEGEAEPAARVALSVGGARQTTFSWCARNRRMLPLSRTLRRLMSDPDTDAAETDPQLVVDFSTATEIRDRSVPPTNGPIPILYICYREPDEIVDLTLVWDAGFGDQATAAEYLSALKRLIEEPRRVLL